eukprot:2639062-Prymnesium_polylepis.1
MRDDQGRRAARAAYVGTAVLRSCALHLFILSAISHRKRSSVVSSSTADEPHSLFSLSFSFSYCDLTSGREQRPAIALQSDPRARVSVRVAVGGGLYQKSLALWPELTRTVTHGSHGSLALAYLAYCSACWYSGMAALQ